jgi:hypothetical protein
MSVRKSIPKPRDPSWRALRALGSKVVRARRGRGSYTRKGRCDKNVTPSGYAG